MNSSFLFENSLAGICPMAASQAAVGHQMRDSDNQNTACQGIHAVYSGEQPINGCVTRGSVTGYAHARPSRAGLE